ncbi:MAG TPA: CGNR zinc finger domain-containing protein [Alphaproteobacteria bacterium]|nr:CGNR zinc finger domain-containing protein [Alphaproteobacteria bacterium]
MLAPASPTLCLDFANTLTWRGSAEPSESLRDLDALFAWAESKAGLDALRDLRAWAAAHPHKAQALFAEAIALRETIFRVFESVAAGAQPRDADFTALRDAIAAAPPRTRLARRNGSYGWQLAAPGPSAPQLLAPVLWSAADLLLSAGRHRIRQCANEKCLWLFVDESKSGTRRWCDMSSCGNRAKAQRHYAKVKRG